MASAQPHEKLLGVFKSTRNFLIDNRRELIGVAVKKAQPEGISLVHKADIEAERRLIPALCEFWPNTPVLCEEAEHSKLADVIDSIKLLLINDTVTDLPDSYISADGLDGSPLYSNGELSLVAMSAALIKNGKPAAAIVLTLDHPFAYSYGIDPIHGLEVMWGNRAIEDWQEPRQPLSKSLIGLDDNKSVDPLFRQHVIAPLMGSKGTRYPLNVPSVSGGLKVLQGKLAAYITSYARNWDIAGTATLCLARGQVVRCLDGTPIPLNRVRMPPVVFARDEEAFEYVQKTAAEYLNKVGV